MPKTLAPAPVEDQAVVLARMILADHAAGRHGLPLPACPECPPIPAAQVVDPAARRAAPPPRPVMVNEPAMVIPPPRPRKLILTGDPKPAVWTDPITSEPWNGSTVIEGEPPASRRARNVTPRVNARKDEPSLIPLTRPIESVVVISPTFPPTRESWLLAAVDLLTPLFEAQDSPPPPVRVSIGWPGGRGPKKGVRGQCWAGTTVADGVPAIFITPDQHDEATILAILLHELIHACGHKAHRGGFAKLGAKLGLTKPWTTATPDEALTAQLAVVAGQLGPFPHSKVTAAGGLFGGQPGPSVQSTRMLLLRCPVDGYSVRTTRKWIEVGLPYCPRAWREEAPDAAKHRLEEVER